MQENSYRLTKEEIKMYVVYLQEQERANNTIKKYTHDLLVLWAYLADRPLSKTILVSWKQHLSEMYAPASVNSMLAAVNNFLNYKGWGVLKINPLKIQKILFCDEKRELTQKEYYRLVKTAQQEGNERLSLVLQTICATGIRVSELQFITAEAIHIGRVEVNNKRKRRIIFLPKKLCLLLERYLRKDRRNSGTIFVTKKGKPLDRSNIWREMKHLCERAKVEPGKVFPHNLRHLFARAYYAQEKDLTRLADILGHTNINTTRIYMVESGLVHAKQIEKMGLVIT